MGDPLSVLREFVSSGRKWKEEGDEVVFGDVRFKKEEETAWRPANRQGYYKLSELVILVEHAHMPYQQYLRTMGGVLKQQSFVSKLDFDNLLKYLRGETATSKQIEQSRLLSRAAIVVPPAGGALKRPAGGDSAKGAADRLDLHLGDVSRSTGLDAQTLQELKRVLETKKQRMEEGAGEEELWKVDGEMHRILKSDEQLVHDRNSVLLTPTADYNIALSMIETAQKRAKEASGKSGGSGAAGGGAGGRKSQFDQRPGAIGSGASSLSSGAAGGSSRLHPPIIIVPSDPSAMVNMTNIVDFLENAHFVGPQERGKSKDALKRVKELTISKVLEGQPRRIKFRVVDNPVWLQEAEWESVVAVFSNGKAWQFSEWKHNTPVDLFHRCFGAVLNYDDDTIRGEVKGWNVKFYKINKSKRHMDGIAVSSFWNQLTEWLKLHKPWVLQPPALGGRK